MRFKITRNINTPESKEFWAQCEKSSEEVSTWPTWKRAGINVAQQRSTPRTIEPDQKETMFKTQADQPTVLLQNASFIDCWQKACSCNLEDKFPLHSFQIVDERKETMLPNWLLDSTGQIFQTGNSQTWSFLPLRSWMFHKKHFTLVYTEGTVNQ